MSFVPRLSVNSPTYMGATSEYPNGNPWWYSNGNKYYRSGYGLPNCTCYCYGRVGEYLGDFDVRVPNGDGGQWYPNAVSAGLLPVGSTPALGAIACWYDPNGQYAGHVAIVEEIATDGTLTLSNSGWIDRPVPPWTFNFWVSYVNSSNGYREQWMVNRGYQLQGFIYTYEEPPTPPTPVPSDGDLPFWMLLRYGL